MNLSGKYKKVSTLKVLIDTWWNVNHDETVKKAYQDGVLIDTWWNVNLHQDGKPC